MEKKMMEKYFETYGKRFSKREKRAFQKAIIEDFKVLGYPSNMTIERAKFTKLENIYIGNPKQAKVAYVIPYNTPARVFWNKHKVYPQDGYYNLKKLFLPTYIPMFVGYGLLLAFVYVVPSFISQDVLNIFYPACFAYLFLLMWFIFKGFGNKHNVQNNSASIVLALQLAQALPKAQKNEAMFIFTDGNKPSTSLANDQVMNYVKTYNKVRMPMFALFCIGRGTTLSLLCDRNHKAVGKELGKKYKGTTKFTCNYRNDSDKNNTVIEKFPQAMMLSSGVKKGDYFVVDGTATPNDCTVDEVVMQDAYTVLLEYMKKRK